MVSLTLGLTLGLAFILTSSTTITTLITSITILTTSTTILTTFTSILTTSTTIITLYPFQSEMKSKEMRVRQRAVALYFIDKLALRYTPPLLTITPTPSPHHLLTSSSRFHTHLLLSSSPLTPPPSPNQGG